MIDAFVAAGVQVWAVAPQPVANNRALRERRGVPFPILADEELEVIHRWGLFNDLDPKQRAIPYPAAYLIGQDGLVAWRHVGLDTRDRPGPDEILVAVRELGAK